MRYFHRLFAGQLRPLDTFLVGFVGLSIALNLIALVLAWPVTLLSLNHGRLAAQLVSALWLVGCLSFSAFIFRAFTRSATATALIPWLRLAGLCLILAGGGQYLYRLIASFHPDLPMSRFAVNREIEAMRLILPQQIAPDATLTQVRLNGEIFEMVIELTGPGLTARRTNLAQTALGHETCNSYRGMLRGRAVSRIENVYRTDSGDFITYLDERDCL